MPLDVGKAFPHAAQQFFVIPDLEIRMNPPLHQNPGAAPVHRFLDFFVDGLVRQNVAFRVAGRAIERTE